MACSQLIVKRTFLELQGTDLNEKDLLMRRSRGLTDSMLESFCPAEPMKVHQVKDSEAQSTVSTALCWSDMSDDEGSESAWSSSSQATALSLPPGVFLGSGEDHVCGKAKRDALWNSATSQETRTTVLFRNVDTSLKRWHLCKLLNEQGFFGRYDFLYMPAHFKTMLSSGYAFVNFVSGQAAEAAKEHFAGFQWYVEAAACTLETCWSEPCQGYEVHVQRYRDSPVMHSSVADEHKPIILHQGVRVPFPAPTKRLIAPRGVRRGLGA